MIRVLARYADWPPIGEVVLVLGKSQVSLEPEDAEVVGSALIEYAASARKMTEMVRTNPGLALGIHSTGGGGCC